MTCPIIRIVFRSFFCFSTYYCTQINCFFKPNNRLYSDNIVRLSWLRLRNRSVSISEDAVPDSGIFSRNAPFCEKRLPFRTFHFLLGAMNPAGVNPERPCGIHQISQYQTPILYVSSFRLIRKYQNHRRCSVKSMYAVCAHNVRIHSFQRFDRLPVLNHDHLSGLGTPAVCRIGNAL